MSLPETSDFGASDTLCTTELFDALKAVKKISNEPVWGGTRHEVTL